MATAYEPRSLSQVRDEARSLLKERTLDSVLTAGKVFGGTVAVFAVFGGGLAVLEKFDETWFLGLIVLSVLIGLLAFVTFEWIRLSKHKGILSELLDSERNYEILLQQSRQENEQTRSELDKIRAEYAMLVTAKSWYSQISPTKMQNPQTDSGSTEGAKND